MMNPGVKTGQGPPLAMKRRAKAADILNAR
jgi:hypothetical protein